ncbi:hypothetical protein GOV13_00650 [Candidatus Pacearchaeota archaeon]|nr:hypothetical protein [Candidatus Pacearchaeota archaeon]
MGKSFLIFGLMFVLLVSFVNAVEIDGCSYLSNEVIEKIDELQEIAQEYEWKNPVRLKEGDNVYNGDYVVLPTPDPEEGIILEFYEFSNDTDTHDDDIVFRDALNKDDLYQVYVIEEGKGDLIVFGQVYSVEYSDKPCEGCDYVVVDFLQTSGDDKMVFEGCEASVACNDSDGGIEEFVQGGVVQGEYALASNDVCEGGETIADNLLEKYCSEEGQSESVLIPCAYGCSTGACRKPSGNDETTNIYECEDSDGGVNFYVPGNTTGGWITYAGSPTTFAVDYCTDGDGTAYYTVRDWYCENGYLAGYEDYTCPNNARYDSSSGASKCHCICVQDSECPGGYTCDDGLCTLDSDEECEEDWDCTSWSDCVNDLKTKTCTDKNDCGTTEDKPSTSQSCVVGECSEDWDCINWGPCMGETQIRTCTDKNSCETIINKPSISKDCTENQEEGGLLEEIPDQGTFTLNGKEVTVKRSEDGKLSVDFGDGDIIDIESSLDLIKDELGAYLMTSMGRQKIEITAKDAIMKASKIDELEKVEIEEYKTIAVYSVYGTKKTRLFFIIPKKAEIVQKISVEDGRLMSTELPWWRFFAVGI